MRRLRNIVLVFLAMQAAQALALRGNRSGSERVSPTVFLETRGNYQTVKSEFMASNDTGFGFQYTLGFHAGETRNIGLLLRTDTSTTSFALNSATMSTTWQDTIVRYRLGWFYLGAVIGQLAITATPGTSSDSTTTETESTESDSTVSEYDAVGSGYGGNLGVTFGVLKRGTMYIDVSSVSMGEMREKNNATISVGSRLDIDLGLKFHVTREFFDVVIGLMSRSYSVTTDSSYTEAMTGTYIGFQFNGFF